MHDIPRNRHTYAAGKFPDAGVNRMKFQYADRAVVTAEVYWEIHPVNGVERLCIANEHPDMPDGWFADATGLICGDLEFAAAGVHPEWENVITFMCVTPPPSPPPAPPPPQLEMFA